MASKEAEAICKHEHVTLQSKGKMPIHVDNGVLCWIFLVVKLGESEGKHNYLAHLLLAELTTITYNRRK